MGNIADLMISLKKKSEEKDEQEQENGPPFGSDKIQKVMEFYQLTRSEIFEIFSVFRRMDSMGTGYINLENIYTMIGEEVGIISPYLERLFSLIKKQHVDKANFLEFLPVLATFCLYTRQQLISFVFCMLDTDHNGFISKKDMLSFVAEERFQLPIFPQNFLLSIDLMEIERPDRISFEQFLSMEQDILFLIYPLARLQKGLQKAFGGRRFWEFIYTRLLRLEKDEEKRNAGFQRDGKKTKTLGTREQKMKTFEDILRSRVKPLYDKAQGQLLLQRQIHRRGSDSGVKTKIPNLLELPLKRHKSGVYRKKEFVAVQEEDDEDNQHNKKKRKSKAKKTTLQRFPTLTKKEQKEPKLGKSITSIGNSSRKKVHQASRKSSLESRHSLAGIGLSEMSRKRSLNEKSQINSAKGSKLNLRMNSNDEGFHNSIVLQ